MHGLGGEVSELLHLVQRLEGNRTVYAIQARGIDGVEEPCDRIEDMATDYLAHVRSIQPHGPYLLAGYSFGGLVALEMARSLRTLGEPVSLLALIDSYRHPGLRPLRARLSVLLKFWLKRLASVRRVSPLRLMNHIAYKTANPFSPSNTRVQRGWYVDPHASPALQRVCTLNYDAWCRYNPESYAEPVSFFRAAVNIAAPSNPAWDWGAILPQLRVYTVPGNHMELIRAQAPALAAQLSQCVLASSRVQR